MDKDDNGKLRLEKVKWEITIMFARYFDPNSTNANISYQFKVVDRGSETELQAGKIKQIIIRLFNPLSAKLFDLNFHPLEIVSRWRDSQLQVSEIFY